MSYSVKVTKQAEIDIVRHIKSGDKKIINKIARLMTELEEHPRRGAGKPEQLKGFIIETWSRRISERHRLIYEIHDNELMVIAISAYGHYGDKSKIISV